MRRATRYKSVLVAVALIVCVPLLAHVAAQKEKTLEERVASLESKVKALEARLSKLEGSVRRGQTGDSQIRKRRPKDSRTQKSRTTPGAIKVFLAGEKYHQSRCRLLGRSRVAVSVEKAKRSGYMPCSVCNPPP